MAKKTHDTSPRFDRHKSYAIGTLQGNAGVSDVPDRFATSPVKPLYLTGMDLIGAGMRSCRDFLISKNCHFRVGSAVHFYEIEYQHNNEPHIYKNIFIGSPLPQSSVLDLPVSEASNLNDRLVKEGHTINNIIPSYGSNEYEKLFFKGQSDSIAYYQKCLQEERKQFVDERNIYTLKQQELNDRILDLNLHINNLKSENESLRIKYEEASKFADRLSQMVQKEEVPPTASSEPVGLADKSVAMLDGMLGDGASQQIVAGLAAGVGNGFGKLIDLGVDFIREKGLIKSPRQTQEQADQIDPVVLQKHIEQMQQQSNTEKFNEELGWQK